MEYNPFFPKNVYWKQYTSFNKRQGVDLFTKANHNYSNNFSIAAKAFYLGQYTDMCKRPGEGPIWDT